MGAARPLTTLSAKRLCQPASGRALIGPNAPQMLGVAMDSYYATYAEPQQAEAMAVITFLLAAVAGVPYLWATARARSARGGAA